jgi:arsenate reductase
LSEIATVAWSFVQIRRRRQGRERRVDAAVYGMFPPAMTATLYAYPGCSTCRAARRWLDDHDVAYTVVDIARDPPSAAVLAGVAARAGIPVRKLFNTSGQLYRDGGYAARLAAMDDAASLADLAAHGMLIRRPVLVRGDVAIVGFRADDYARALA